VKLDIPRVVTHNYLISLFSGMFYLRESSFELSEKFDSLLQRFSVKNVDVYFGSEIYPEFIDFKLRQLLRLTIEENKPVLRELWSQNL